MDGFVFQNRGAQFTFRIEIMQIAGASSALFTRLFSRLSLKMESICELWFDEEAFSSSAGTAQM